jgi:hypothetical protein
LLEFSPSSIALRVLTEVGSFADRVDEGSSIELNRGSCPNESPREIGFIKIGRLDFWIFRVEGVV